MSDPTKAESRGKHNWLQFSLRSVLIAMLLIATYAAGWLSHKHFHNRNLNENVAAAVNRIETKKAAVEVLDDAEGVTVVRGATRQDVNDVISAIKRVKEAAAE